MANKNFESKEDLIKFLKEKLGKDNVDVIRISNGKVTKEDPDELLDELEKRVDKTDKKDLLKLLKRNIEKAELSNKDVYEHLVDTFTETLDSTVGNSVRYAAAIILDKNDRAYMASYNLDSKDKAINFFRSLASSLEAGKINDKYEIE